VPAAAQRGRLLEPALAVGVLVGDRAERQRAELSYRGLPLFYARYRLWPEGGERGGWLELVGVGVSLTGEPLPLVKLPGFQVEVGRHACSALRSRTSRPGGCRSPGAREEGGR